MASRLSLILVAVLLGCGSAALWFARRYSPALRGLGWLGLSFASGAAGVVFLLADHADSAVLHVLIPDLLLLLAFVLLHVGVLNVSASASLVPSLGISLLVLQIATDSVKMYGAVSDHLRVAIVCILLAAQMTETSIKLFKVLKRGAQAPARLTASILICLVVLNLSRSAAFASAMLMVPALFLQAEKLTFAIYVMAAVGIAFGFFWMSSAIQANRLEHMASTDSLTRLFNRRVFLVWCEKEWLKSQRTGALFSVLMIDLDHFKQINDTYGHQVGDEVLCASVEKIQDAVRGIDVIGRWGGEEFAALLPGASEEAAFRVAERVRRNIERVLLPASGKSEGSRASITNVTACVGVSTYQGSHESIRELMHRADKALYQAKANGRNSVSAEHDSRQLI